MKDPVFIVGTGRCGSTMLSNMVRLHPNLLSVSEFFTSLTSRAFWKRNATGEDVFRLLNTQSPGGRALLRNGFIVEEFLYPLGSAARYAASEVPPILCATLPHLTTAHESLWDALSVALRARGQAPIAMHYRFVFEWLANRFEKEVWIERSGLSLPYVPVFAKRFPDARFVHIQRDGRDTAMSMSRHHYFRLRVQSEERLLAVGIDPSRPFNMLGTSPWVPYSEWLWFQFFSAKRYRRTQIGLDAFGRFWSRLIVNGTAALGALPPERVLTLRYETVLAEPRRELERFIRFVGPEFENEQWLEAAIALVRPQVPRWPGLGKEDLQALSAACAPGQALLGYD